VSSRAEKAERHAEKAEQRAQKAERRADKAERRAEKAERRAEKAKRRARTAADRVERMDAELAACRRELARRADDLDVAADTIARLSAELRYLHNASYALRLATRNSTAVRDLHDHVPDYATQWDERYRHMLEVLGVARTWLTEQGHETLQAVAVPEMALPEHLEPDAPEQDPDVPEA